MVYADYHCPDQMVSLLAVMARSRGIKFEAGLITERMSVLDHYYKVYYDWVLRIYLKTINIIGVRNWDGEETSGYYHYYQFSLAQFLNS